MDLLLVLLSREFFTEPRRKWFHAKRTVFAAVCGVMVLVGFAGQFGLVNNSTTGLVLFRYLSTLAIIAASLLAPYVAAGALVSERENRTLDLLYMSELGSAVLVVGKLLTSTFGALLTILSVVPLFFLCVSLGGISELQIVLALAVIASVIVLGSCLGLLTAAFVDTDVQMQRLLVVVYLVWFLLMPISVGTVVYLFGGDPRFIAEIVSPYAAMFTLATSNVYHTAVYHLIFNLLMALPILGLTCVALPRRIEHGVPFWFKRLARHLNNEVFKSAASNAVKRPALEGNPVLWHDLHVIYGGEARIWRRFIFTMGVVVFGVSSIGGGLLMVFGRYQLETLLGAVSLACLITCAANFVIGSVTRSATALSREKANSTLELLLSSDITVTDIVDGKSGAVMLSVLPWAIGVTFFTLSFAMVAMFYGTMQLTGIVACIVVPINIIGMVFAYNHLAMLISLQMNRATTAITLTGFAVWYILGNCLLGLLGALFIPFTAFLSIIFLPLVGPIAIGLQARMLLLRRFRQMVAQHQR